MKWLAEFRCRGHDGKMSVLGQHEVEADTEDQARKEFELEWGRGAEIISIAPSEEMRQ